MRRRRFRTLLRHGIAGIQYRRAIRAGLIKQIATEQPQYAMKLMSLFHASDTGGYWRTQGETHQIGAHLAGSREPGRIPSRRPRVVGQTAAREAHGLPWDAGTGQPCRERLERPRRRITPADN